MEKLTERFDAEGAIEGIERMPVGDDWLKSLFGDITPQQAQPEKSEEVEKKQETELEKQVAELRAYIALMQLNALVERVKNEFYNDKPHLKPHADIIDKLAAAKISEILSGGAQIDNLDKVAELVRGALNEVGKQIEERFGLSKRSAAAELVNLPPSNVAASGGTTGGEEEWSKYGGVDLPISSNMVARVVSEEDLWKWRKEMARKMIEERIKDMKKKQQSWVEGYRR